MSFGFRAPRSAFESTTPDNLLSDTLKAQGKEAVVDICRWNEDRVHDREPVFEPMGDHRPTPDQPVVFHLFGNLDDPQSLVLREDDHFDFLTGFFRFKDHIPGVVRAAHLGPEAAPQGPAAAG